MLDISMDGARAFHEFGLSWYRRVICLPFVMRGWFIAQDVKRRLEIVSLDRLDEGRNVGRVRTNDTLYVYMSIVEEQGYGEPESWRSPRYGTGPVNRGEACPMGRQSWTGRGRRSRLYLRRPRSHRILTG